MTVVDSDLATLMDSDPCMEGGFRLLYDREVPIEIRYTGTSGGAEQTSVEGLRVRVLVSGTAEHYTVCKVELSSETDLFFHLAHRLDGAAYTAIQKAQRLTVNFSEYSVAIMKALNSCIRDPKSFVGVLSVSGSGSSRLEFVQNLEYKYVELMQLPFEPASAEYTRRMANYRFQFVKARLAETQTRLSEMQDLVKIKNPSLLLHIQKGRDSVKSTSKRI